MRFDKSVMISGVILNNVASERHAQYLTDAVNSSIKLPIVGLIRRDAESRMEERHLGLIPALELNNNNQKLLRRSAKKIGEQIDVAKLLDMFGKQPLAHKRKPVKTHKTRARIAVAMDQSFNFYYHDNLEALRSAGAQLVFFSPVSDTGIPANIDGLILGGGFPEILADSLASNLSMLRSTKKAAEDCVPIYAECGGLMYLTRSISGYKESSKKHRMVGVIDAETEMTGRLTLNYTQGDCDGPILGRFPLRGHEFHYSRLSHVASDTRFSYSLVRGKGIEGGKDGIAFNENGLAAYGHLHFSGNSLAERIVEACASYSRA
jgi:cobyrinic acid a,c-diamide synthase